MKVRTRFAPSPTGFMHIGNLRTALYAYLYAKHNNGAFVLRIEDTDRERYVEGAVDLIYSTLSQSGIQHDEGPDKDGGVGPYIQSERKQIYIDYAKKLVERGGAYYCFCSKERLEGLTDANGVRKYDKHCLSLSREQIEDKLKNNEPYVIRQNVPKEGVSEYEDMVYGKISVDYADLEDNILLKSDGMPTYNFANVIDDHLMNITHVIRGTEYLSSTPKYNLLYDSFGWARPVYIHLPPIMKDATRKLSKRYGDANFNDFIEKGYLAEAIINYIALLGWSPKDNTEKLSMNRLIELFDVNGLNKSPAIFDENKMKWLNGQYIRDLSEDDFYRLSIPYFEKSKVCGKYDYKLLAKLLHSRVEIFSEIPDKIDFLEEYRADFDTEYYMHKKMKCDKTIAQACIKDAIDLLGEVDESAWNNDVLFKTLTESVENKSYKKSALLWAVRIAITAVVNTPGGATEMAEILGKQKTLERLTQAYEILYNTNSD